MDKNLMLSNRFAYFSKYLRIIALLSAIAFLITNAINTGNGILYWISYTTLMLAFIAVLQSIILYVLARYFKTKVR